MEELLDEIDRKILAVLQRDGRTPVAQISEEIGLSRPAVSERMEKLERQGILLGTTAVVNPDAMGGRITAFISARENLTRGPRARAQKAFGDLLERDEVVEVHSVAGEDCYLLKVRASSIEALNDILALLNSPPLSMATRTTIVLQTHVEKIGGVQRTGGGG